MKIKLAIIEKNQEYLNRIAAALSIKYSDQIETYLFSDSGAAANSVQNVHVILAYEGCDISQLHVGKDCSIAYLTDRTGVDQISGLPAVSRFQKLESIYKQVLNLYSENASNIISIRNESGNVASVIAFTSPCGGTGTSTAAVACAIHFAAQGKKTLYLNLETFGTASLYFDGQGQFSMSDIIYAIKNRKANLQMKLESCVRQDPCGVFFFSETMMALDQMELEHEEILRLLTELKLSGQYDRIVVDADFSLDQDIVRLYSKMDTVVWVSDGTESSHVKIERAIECVETIDKIDKQAEINEIALLYNKSAEAEMRNTPKSIFRVVGSIPQYRAASARQIAMSVATSSVFDEI